MAANSNRATRRDIEEKFTAALEVLPVCSLAPQLDERMKAAYDPDVEMQNVGRQVLVALRKEASRQAKKGIK